MAAIDPASCTVAEWNSATHLDVLSMHDTMNHTARPDGAICVERNPIDRLPAVVALSNRGDENGDIVPSDEATIRDDAGVPTMDPARLRVIGRAYQIAFEATGPDDVAYNRPYPGGHETTTLGPILRRIEPLAVIRPTSGITRQLRLGAWMNEFLREFLLGPESTQALMQPGIHWVAPPDDRIEWLATRLTSRPRSRPQLGRPARPLTAPTRGTGQR